VENQMRTWALVLIFAVASMAAAERVRAAGGQVIVNGQPLDQEIVQAYQIPAGRYWYDVVAGFWGMEGEPIAGQIQPGLQLGGWLRPDASNGTSGVFVNGRQLTSTEVQYLEQRFGQVMPGRYWLNAQLVGGVEGGPPAFYLGDGSGGSAGEPGANVRTLFGDIISDGSCTFVNLPGGSSVGAGSC
jgi:hypothetical protein